MHTSGWSPNPAKPGYDVVIVGGAIMGSAVAWFLASDPDFDGSVLVIERDPSYVNSSTARTNSCIRQQFSQSLNVRISQFAAGYIRDFRNRMGGDERIPDILLQSYGYLYLAATSDVAKALIRAQAVQAAEGAATRLLTRDEIAAAWPFYALDDIRMGSHNPVNEGYWDGGTVFEWWRRRARERGVEYVATEVVAMTTDRSGRRVASVTLASGQRIHCGHVVNACGPRAAATARMVGIALPVEPRKRFTWVFTAERPLDRTLPLTIDPGGIHVRQDGPTTYLAGGHPDPDPAVDTEDFGMDADFWLDRVWPVLAARIPQFGSIRVIGEWAGHYAYNTFDQNAVVGPHPEVTNFIFVNGFSGHGLQQSPAMGRGVAELLIHGAYRSLDLTPMGYERIVTGTPFTEAAVI